jgi:hypothetical protein
MDRRGRLSSTITARFSCDHVIVRIVAAVAGH